MLVMGDKEYLSQVNSTHILCTTAKSNKLLHMEHKILTAEKFGKCGQGIFSWSS